jgi:hypothetical protein
MLVACRLADLSALEAHYAGIQLTRAALTQAPLAARKPVDRAGLPKLANCPRPAPPTF